MSDELLTLLKHVDPVDRESILARPAPAEELTRILDGRPAGGDPKPPPRRPLARPRRLVVAAGGAAAVLGVVAASLPGGGAASPEAARALESVAAVAAAEPAPAAGGYAYSRVRRVTLATMGDRPAYSWYEPTTIEQWVAADGSGRVIETTHEVEWPGPRDVQRWREHGDLRLPSEDSVDRRYGPGELDGSPYESELPPVRELPTDADDLERIFREEAGESSASVPASAKTFEYGTSVLLQAGSAPDLRAAAFEVLAGIDGVELEGEAQDPLGRVGTGVSLTTGYSGLATRHTLVFDSETSHPLAYVERLLEPAIFIDSRTLGYTVLEESGQVADVRSRP